jgi:hypothetical protein
MTVIANVAMEHVGIDLKTDIRRAADDSQTLAMLPIYAGLELHEHGPDEHPDSDVPRQRTRYTMIALLRPKASRRDCGPTAHGRHISHRPSRYRSGRARVRRTTMPRLLCAISAKSSTDSARRHAQ